MPPASPRTLVSRQRSTGLEREYTIVRQMRGPKAPPYPALAAPWIDEAHYLRMDREAQIMIVGFAAIRSVYESAQRIFGKHWSWSSDMPMRNWAQKGNVVMDESAYFTSKEAFSAAYREGRLSSDLAGALNEVEAEFERNKTAAIVKLAKQADHVLLHALGSLRTLTRRPDVSPEELRAVWNAMTADQPTSFQLGVLRSFFSESSCLAIQALVHASSWLCSEVAAHCTPEPGEPPTTILDLLSTFYFMFADALGMKFGDLQKLFNKLERDHVDASLKELGLGADALLSILESLEKKARESLKDTVDIEQSIRKLRELENKRIQTLTIGMSGTLEVLLKKLVHGDRRFLDAWGLQGITGATPSSLPVDVRWGNSSSSPLTRGANAQSPRDRLVERRRSESSPVKRIMTVERGVRVAQGPALPSPRRADSPRVQNSPARPGDASRAAPSPLKPQLDQ